MMLGLTPMVRPGAIAVGGVDQHPGDRARGRGPVEDAHLVVGEVHPVELRVAPCRRRRAARESIALTGPLPSAVCTWRSAADVHLDGRLGGEVAARRARR